MSENKEYLKIGSYTPPDENGRGEKIVREFYGQGTIFKDDEAFYDTEHPDRVCYIPELSNTKYTRNSILQECNDQTDLAEEVYEAVDWQHVSSLLEDWQRNGELDTYKECGKIFNCYGETKCPYCGAKYNDEMEKKGMKEMILSELVEAVKKAAGEGYEVMIRQVQKNNGVQTRAISYKRENDLVVANVYVDWFIEAIAGKEMTVDEAAKEVIRIVKENKVPECCIDTSRLTEKDFILSHVEYQVVNRERNWEQIAEMPHRDVLDLAALYRVIVDSDASNTASYALNNKMLEQIGISVEELDEAADRNTKRAGFEVRTMAEIMAEIAGMPEESIHEMCGELQMYVLTNIRRTYGANVLLYNNILGNLADEVGDDLFILPSSIHEVLAVSAAHLEPGGLSAMVGEVNSNEVADEEILGYQVYKYSRVTGELNIA